MGKVEKRDDDSVTTGATVAAGRSPATEDGVAAGRSPATADGVAVSQSQLEFPWLDLPWQMTLLVDEASAALGVDPPLIAGPCLAALAGCIGNRRRIVVKSGTWTEAAVLWVAIVMRSGGKKTPAMGLVLEYLQEREAAELAEAQARKAEYEKELENWKSAPKDQRGDRPEKPEPAMRMLVSDVTTEAVLAIHADAPLGLLLHRDELAGWLRSFNQYKGGGRGGDAQCWAEMHQGRPALVDRKGGPTLSVPRACVSICGGLQPEVLNSTLAGEHLHDGITSRVLFIAPFEKVKRWSDATISDDTHKAWAGLLDGVLALRPNEDGTPVDLHMTAQAKASWIRYYNDHAQREADAEGPLTSALSKLEAATARLALIIQVGYDPQSTEVDVGAMKAAIKVSEWFEEQARRVYAGIEESEQDRDRRKLREWIGERGGSITVRDLTRLGPLKFRKSAKEALDDLVTTGFAERRREPGRKADTYYLCDCDSCDTSNGEPN